MRPPGHEQERSAHVFVIGDEIPVDSKVAEDDHADEPTGAPGAWDDLDCAGNRQIALAHPDLAIGSVQRVERVIGGEPARQPGTA